VAIKRIDYFNEEFPISYKIINSDAKESILFLHGWGSNKWIMEQAFGEERDFKLIFIDMPGFGSSPNESEVLTTDDYARIIALFLKELGESPKIIVGHSFGGKVATLLNPECLILLSSAGIPTPKPLSIKFKIALFKMLSPFGIKGVRKFFVADDAKDVNQAMYETFKRVVNEDFRDKFREFNGKALLFWGKEDTATPLWTGEEIKLLISGSKLYPLDGDHYFFLKHATFIMDKIKSECKDIYGNSN
jgi:pimeloyl-ACP methyl ester carboxylesterase